MSTSSAPLDRPLPDATPVQAVVRYVRNYAVFTGRASRSEYWWVICFDAIVVLALALPALTLTRASSSIVGDTTRIGAAGAPFIVLLAVFLLASICPSITIYWRRMHDANLPGTLWFLRLIPSIGDLVCLILALLPSNPAGVRFDRFPADSAG